jgi:uncharacterized protein
MRWKPTGRSDADDNVEDRRGQGGGGGGFSRGGLGGGLPMGKGKGIGGVIILILAAVLGGGKFLGGGGDGGGFGNIGNAVDNNFPQAPAATGNGGYPAGADPEAKLKDFAKSVFSDTQATWSTVFKEGGSTYRPAKMILFSGSTDSTCGPASAATGPFYCPPDRSVYLDLGFYKELRDKYGAPGEFAQAYVIAHEVGHHVQNLLGINDQVRQRSQAEPRQANELSVRLELQADCMSGVWAQSQFGRGNLTDQDIQDGLNAAAAVGDDRIQKAATGRINPESFTHGSAEKRAKWFNEGFAAGSINACNTFNQDI